MKVKRLLALTIMVVISLLIGCNQHARSTGGTEGSKGCQISTLIVDPQGNPIPGAIIHVWAYALEPDDAQTHAANIGRRLEGGEPMLGWHFTTNKRGRANCSGFYEFGKMEESSKYVVTTSKKDPPDASGEKKIYRYGHDWEIIYPDGTIIIVQEKPRKDNSEYNSRHKSKYNSKDDDEDQQPDPEFVPRTDHWWLAVTIEAQGYKLKHFAFNPESPDRALAQIALDKDDSSQFRAKSDNTTRKTAWFGEYSIVK